MKSQEGQCAPVFSPTQGPVCQDVAALVIISGAHKLFPRSSGLRFSSKLGEGARGQVFFCCCFLFMDITSSALQVLKMFLFFWDGISKHLCILFSVSPPTFFFCVEGGQETK